MRDWPIAQNFLNLGHRQFRLFQEEQKEPQPGGVRQQPQDLMMEDMASPEHIKES